MIEKQASSRVKSRKSSKMSQFDQKIFMLRLNINDSFDLKYEFSIDEAEESSKKENVIEKKIVERKNVEKKNNENKNIENEF